MVCIIDRDSSMIASRACYYAINKWRLTFSIDYYTYGTGLETWKFLLTMRVSQKKKSANSMHAAGIVLLARVAALKEHWSLHSARAAALCLTSSLRSNFLFPILPLSQSMRAVSDRHCSKPSPAMTVHSLAQDTKTNLFLPVWLWLTLHVALYLLSHW